MATNVELLLSEFPLVRPLRRILPRFNCKTGALWPGPRSPGRGGNAPCPAAGRGNSGELHRDRVGEAERPSGTSQGDAPLPSDQLGAGDCQARPSGPQLGLHRQSDGGRRPLRRLRLSDSQRADRPHHGVLRPVRGQDDLGAHQGGAGGGQGARHQAGQPARRDLLQG